MVSVMGMQGKKYLLARTWVMKMVKLSALIILHTTCHHSCISGEYGIVYKGFLVKSLGEIVTELVAIKTLKGLAILHNHTVMEKIVIINKDILCRFL